MTTETNVFKELNEYLRAASKYPLLTAEQVESIRRQALQLHVSYRELAELNDLPYDAVCKACNGSTYASIDGPIFPQQNDRPVPGSRLSYDDADTIRERYAAGEKQKDLAREYNVHFTMISHIVHYRRLVRPGTEKQLGTFPRGAVHNCLWHSDRCRNYSWLYSGSRRRIFHNHINYRVYIMDNTDGQSTQWRAVQVSLGR